VFAQLAVSFALNASAYAFHMCCNNAQSEGSGWQMTLQLAHQVCLVWMVTMCSEWLLHFLYAFLSVYE
jgi:hypothetical protein